MRSPESTTAVEDGFVPPTVVRRKRRRALGFVVPLLAVVALAFTSTGCTPKQTAQDAIRKYWGSNSLCAERIVKRESNYNASAVNPYSKATGLFQIHPTHATWIKAKYGYSFTEMKDPYKNSRVAKGLSTSAYNYWGDGWQPWRIGGDALRGGGCPA